MILDTFEAVLSELDDSGEEEFGGGWLDLVKERLVQLEASYRVLTDPDRDPIDYSELPTQAAYVFAYGMPRAGFAYELLKRHRAALGRPLFERRDIKVTSVGGGPASELIGLLAYLEDPESDEDVESIEYRLTDKDGEWEHVARLVAANAVTDIEIDLTFEELDLTDEEAVAECVLDDDDLVIFSYIISEVCAFDAKLGVESSIRNMFRTIRSGSFVLYIDSQSFPFYSFFNECKKYVKGLRQRNEHDGRLEFAVEEMPELHQEYCDSLDREPRMECNIVSKFLERD